MTAPLCKDCRWCERSAISDLPFDWKCMAPQGITTNLVTGDQYRRLTACQSQRSVSGALPHKACGAEGHWFQPKEAANV